MARSLIAYTLALAVAGLSYGLFKLIRHRLFYRNLPKPPHSFLWGHLKLFDEISKGYPPNMHPGTIFTHMKHVYDLPEVFYVDLWPFAPPMMVCASPDAAAEVTQIRSLSKHPETGVVLDPLVGEDSIPVTNGPTWRIVHHMLTPAFRPANVRALVSIAADEGRFFATEVLAPFAASGEAFSMEAVMSRLIFDIITRSLVGVSFGSQIEWASSGKNPSNGSGSGSGSCSGSGTGSQNPSMIVDIQSPVHILRAETSTWNPLKRLRLRKQRIDTLARSGAWIRQAALTRYGEIIAQGIKAPQSVMDSCLIERIEAERAKGTNVTTSLPHDEAWLRLFGNNMRALFLGGQGTTTDTMIYVFMLLSVHPEALARLRSEHDRVCGRTLDAAVQMLQSQPHRAAAELEYTTAVVRETLRLYPIGFSVRADDKSDRRDQHVVVNGVRYPTKGQMICSASHVIHHDPSLFPDPGCFLPERWLTSSNSTEETAGTRKFPPIPRNSFRAFELGARACMGREIAVDEMRAILLLTARWYDFEVADPRPNPKPRTFWTALDTTALGDQAFQELGMEAKPRGGAMMRARRTEREF